MKKTLEDYVEILKKGGEFGVDSDISKVLLHLVVKISRNEAMLEKILDNQVKLMAANHLGEFSEIPKDIEAVVQDRSIKILGKFLEQHGSTKSD